jgi:hypothetical protein
MLVERFELGHTTLQVDHASPEGLLQIGTGTEQDPGPRH